MRLSMIVAAALFMAPSAAPARFPKKWEPVFRPGSAQDIGQGAFLVRQGDSALAGKAPALDPSWTGTWHGVLQNLPGRAGAERIDVTFEAGKLPEREGECATWRTRYLHGSELRHLKDYRLCRLAGEGEYTVDEGDGIKLPTRLLGDTLYSIFKYDDHLLTVITRKRGDMLEQEIISATDQPAGKGVVTLHPSSVQRTTLSRAKP